MPPSGEKYEPLGGGIFALTSTHHTFGTDAVLLADFASPRSEKRLCDLCAGCGIVSLLWSRDGSFSIDAIELQSDAAALAKSAAEYNRLENVHVIEADLRCLETSLYGRYDLVACNPPYQKAGSGALSAEGTARTARHETSCTLEDAVTAGAKLLKNGGRLCLCHRPERLTDLLVLMRSHKVEPKRVRFVQQRADTKPWLVLAEGKKGAHPGLLTMPVLLCEDETGGYSEEMRRIYRL